MGISPRTLRPSSNFSPRSISGLALWLDASDGATLFQNSDGTVPATATSDPVGYWGDKSGNGRHLTTSDASTRPVIHSATHNGRKVLDFDGANDTLSRENYTAESDLTGLTRFGVFYSDSGAGPFHLSSVYNGGSYSSFARTSSFLTTYAGLSNSSQHANVSSVLTTGTTPRVFCARYDGTAGSFAAGLNIIMDGVTLPVASTTGTFPSSLPGGSPSLFIGSNIRANNWLNGKLCEYISYARALTTAERQRVERYLAARWGITLAPTVSNADAQNWIDRVYSNGGTVSSATAAAVNQFCDAIDAASLRSKMLRLNLFCGTGLNAALVPLYRAASLGDTQLGNATDTNVGPFVSGDFADATGLAAGSGKYLRTGLTQTSVGLACHLAFYECAKPTNAYANRIGSRGAGDANEHQITNVDVATTMHYGSGPVAGNGRAISTGYTQAGAFWLGINPSATSAILYKNGVSAATASPPARTAQSLEYWLFALNNNGSIDSPMTTGRSGGYSIGLSMDATQAAAYNTAMQAFQTSLARNA